MFIQHGDLALRFMRDETADYEQMAKWLTDERVLEFYEGRDNPFPLERVMAEYSPRALAAESVTPCFIVYNRAPIGYMQYYVVGPNDYGLAESESVYGIDMFIGEPDYWNRGIGTRAVSLLLDYLFDTLRATKVVLDTEAWNARAIRCYEKCGFHKIKLLPAHELHEGEYRDSWLMAIENPARASPIPNSNDTTT